MFTAISEAVSRLAHGEMVVVVDDADRENEGDLIMAADHVSPTAINFMSQMGRGLICMPAAGPVLDRLEIHPMLAAEINTGDTPFAISIDHIDVGTGIAAEARAETVRQVLNPESRPSDFRRPGHMFPLRARNGGVLERRGHTEASVDLARLAGCTPAGVLCEVLHLDGSAARTPYLELFATEHNLSLISIEQLAQYRLETELPEIVDIRAAETNQITTAQDERAALSTRYGE